MDDKEVARKGYGAASEQTRSQNSVYSLVVAFCVYLVPRVAINFFYYPDDKNIRSRPLVGGIRRIYG